MWLNSFEFYYMQWLSTQIDRGDWQNDTWHFNYLRTLLIPLSTHKGVFKGKAYMGNSDVFSIVDHEEIDIC